MKKILVFLFLCLPIISYAQTGNMRFNVYGIAETPIYEGMQYPEITIHRISGYERKAYKVYIIDVRERFYASIILDVDFLQNAIKTGGYISLLIQMDQRELYIDLDGFRYPLIPLKAPKE